MKFNKGDIISYTYPIYDGYTDKTIYLGLGKILMIYNDYATIEFFNPLPQIPNIITYIPTWNFDHLKHQQISCSLLILVKSIRNIKLEQLPYEIHRPISK
ncbi:MAG: hypothetical protein ABSG25_04115 [Bryobacteraceae bacterium]